MGQPHMLSYINPQEEAMLQKMRGGIPPVAGPGGVPAFAHGGFHWSQPSTWGGGSDDNQAADTSNDDDDDDDDFSLSQVFSDFTDFGSSFVSDLVSGAEQIGSAVGSGIETVGSAIGALTGLGSDSDTDQDLIDQTVASNPGSSFDINTGITGSGGESIDVGSNVFIDQSTGELLDNSEDELLNQPAMMDDAVAQFYADQEADLPNITSISIGGGFSNLVDNLFGTETGEEASLNSDLSQEEGNTFIENVSNILTPFDGTEYQDGVLIDTETGEETTGVLDTLSDTADYVFGTGEEGNSLYQDLANTFTPDNGTTYVDGVLMSDQLAIDSTISSNEGSSYDGTTGIITGADGNEIDIGTNVNADDVSSGLYSELLPGGSEGDYDDFQTRYNAQSIAAELDPYGSSTATGFLVNEGFTADLDGDGIVENYIGGTEYTVNTDGSVVVADSEEDTTGGLSLLGESLIELELAEPLNEGEFADGSGTTDLTELGGGEPEEDEPEEQVQTIFEDDDDDEPDPSFTTTPTFEDQTTQEAFQRRYKGGGGGFLPAYMQQYMSGETIDEYVRMVTLADGSVYYITPDGRYIDPEVFEGTAIVTDSTEYFDTGTEQVQTGYTVTDNLTGVIQTFNMDGVLLDTFDPQTGQTEYASYMIADDPSRPVIYGSDTQSGYDIYQDLVSQI
jgi:hypothetical protein